MNKVTPLQPYSTPGVGARALAPALASVLAATVLAALVWGCADPAPFTISGVKGASHMALVCRNPATGEGFPLSRCMSAQANKPGSPRIQALITSTRPGRVGVLDLNTGQLIDSVKEIPGTTGIPVGRVPLAIEVSGDGLTALVINGGTNDLSIINVGELCETARIGLPSRPTGLAISSSGQVAVTLPEAGEVGFIDLEDCLLEQFECLSPQLNRAQTTKCVRVTTVPVTGFPTNLAFSPDGTRLAVADGRGDHMSVLDPDGGEVLDTVPVVPRCGGDQLYGAGPLRGCILPDGSPVFTEDQWPPNGEESEYEGNGDEEPGEEGDHPDEGIDGDGDEDGNGTDRDVGVDHEGEEDENGDGDGDGGTDWDEEPDGALDNGEDQEEGEPDVGHKPPTEGVGNVGVLYSPDGKFIYVLNRTRRELMILDSEDLTLINTNRAVPLSTNPGISLGGLPRSGAFTCFEGVAKGTGHGDGDTFKPALCQENPDLVLLTVGLANGRVVVVEVSRDGEPVNQPYGAVREDGPALEAPRLYINNRLEDFSGPPPDQVPAFTHDHGEFTEESSWGVTLVSDQENFPVVNQDWGKESIPTDQQWSVTWEGIIPGSTGSLGTLSSEPPVCSHEEETHLTQEGDSFFLTDCRKNFCNLGIEPGDHLLINPPPSSLERTAQCQTLYPSMVPNGREGYEYCVAEVSSHHLKLVPVGAEEDPEKGHPVAARGKTGENPCVEGNGDGEVLDPTIYGLEDSCFTPFVSYKIRAAEEFIVYSSSTMATNKMSLDGQCVTRPDAAPMRQSRALLDEPFFNTTFMFTMEPPLTGEIPSIPRGLSWQLGIKGHRHTPNHTPITFVAAQSFNPATGQTVMVDGLTGRVVLFNPLNGQVTSAIQR